MDNYETPSMAFRNKWADEEIRMHNPNRMGGHQSLTDKTRRDMILGYYMYLDG